MKYEYWKAKKNGTWSWDLKADDGQVVAQGEGYDGKSAVLHAIDLVKLSRPAELNVRQSRRYRLSFAALLAFIAAMLFLWLAAESVRPRWDASLVIIDAAVVSTGTSGSGRMRSVWTQVRFSVPDGRIFTRTIYNSSVDKDATTVRIRYNRHDPTKVLEDSSLNSYMFALGLLIVVGAFLFAAYAASLHDEESDFMYVHSKL